MTRVILAPRNPLDLRPEDLEPLVAQIRERMEVTVEVRVSPQRGYAVTWWEVFVIYLLNEAADVAVKESLKQTYKLLIEQITEIVRNWYRKRRASKRNKRPLSLRFLNEKDHELRAVEMRAEEESDNADKKSVKSRHSRRKSAGEKTKSSSNKKKLLRTKRRATR